MNATAGHRASDAGGGVLSWAWFIAWAGVGAALAVGLVSLGPLALVPAAAVAAVMLSRPASRRGAFGVLSGAGALLLVVAWINRQGPSTTCWHTATASGCDQHLDPIPWLVVGVVLVLAGVAGRLTRGR